MMYDLPSHTSYEVKFALENDRIAVYGFFGSLKYNCMHIMVHFGAN